MTQDVPTQHRMARLGVATNDMPTLKGEGLVPLRMEPPGASGGLEPISFAPGLEPISEEVLRSGRVVASRPVGEQQELTMARKRASELGLFE